VKEDIKFPVSRETLYEQVWSEPMLSLAKKYNVSSSYLARVCTRLNVPRPARGYWAKLAHGKPVHKPALPEESAEFELEWVKGGFESESMRRQPTFRRQSSP
jgi:hypothetical protein